MWWHPPKMWPNKTTYIIGGGPSLRGIDWTPLIQKHKRGECRVIGVNDAYALGPWVDATFFGDSGWFKLHTGEEAIWNEKGSPFAQDAVYHSLRDYPGLLVTSNRDETEARWYEDYGVRVMFRIPSGFLQDTGKLCWNSSSGASALHLAVLFGCDPIILLGFDLRPDRETGKNNWHPNPRPIRNEVYPSFIYGLGRLRINMEEQGIKTKIFNANPDSAMNDWPKISLKKAWGC